MRLASRFGRYNSIRRERPLTDDELMQFVPSVFSGDKHESRSERYTYIPTISSISYVMKVSSHSLPVRVGFVIWDVANTVNICYVFAGKGILTGRKFLKLSCLIHMMVHPVIR
ncbi:hypothetical protein BvCmsOUP082_03444 [Escherichia coli]|uniref:YubP n=1 Tax=Escherichia coli TaxID=562 RepID=A0AB38F2X8_ECOLX|nr:hypothetical protein BvCmsHHP003_02816 [Escherichia coli]GDT61291.1 hypothetical protein BvCmsOUP082_03444 [Escherichia coli]GDU76640.1 hypothetical protein BvCmsSIP006_02170 [Escherichia coli]CTZ76133.1 YubP [Escherichia coli]SPX32026.1 YubP [Escherichia coli]